jgi:phospholipid/cholesterol/gamma-HCH transport system ATP-binding protein
MIEVSNLTVQFDDNKVLDDISCKIEKSKITSIIGKSGTGKSVLMKTVLGLIKHSEGDIYIDGISVNNADKSEIKSIQAKMSMLFQNSALFDSMTIFQNVGFPLFEHTKLSYNEIKDKVEEVIELVNLSSNIFDLYPSDLSGGMRKRVALARAIIQEPEYLIYDEPTTGLDPVTAEDIINLIESLYKKLSMTSIVITHDPECIKQLTNTLIMLDKGKIVFDDDFSRFRGAEHPTARQFVGHIF